MKIVVDVESDGEDPVTLSGSSLVSKEARSAPGSPSPPSPSCDQASRAAGRVPPESSRGQAHATTTKMALLRGDSMGRSSKGGNTYNHENLSASHKACLAECQKQNEVLQAALDALLTQVGGLAETLYGAPHPHQHLQSPSKWLKAATRCASAFPVMTCRIRRHCHLLASWSDRASALSEDMQRQGELAREALVTGVTDMALNLDRIVDQDVVTPACDAVLPHLYPRQEFEDSLKAVCGTDAPLLGAARNDDSDPTAVSPASSGLPMTGAIDEEFLLQWLEFDLVRRKMDAEAIATAKSKREAEEEKLKLLRRRESELFQKLSPVEKELQKYAEALSTNTQEANAPNGVSASTFPPEVFSLPSPLFHLYTQIFTYKSISGDKHVDCDIVTVETTKPPSEQDVMRPHPSRLQVTLGSSAAEELPPPTYPRAASLLPLKVRFSYFPRLQVCSALCQFPKAIGSDATFFTDLFYSNDDGCSSPNPLHHLLSSLDSIQPALGSSDKGRRCSPIEGSERTSHLMSDDPQNELVAGYDERGSLQIKLPAKTFEAPIAQRVAAGIADSQRGRPYRWVQQLSQITYSISDPPLTHILPPKDAAPVTVQRFIEAFRARVALRAWTLYLEESLKEKPKVIPPPGVELPVALVPSAAAASRACTAAKSASQKDFAAFLCAADTGNETKQAHSKSHADAGDLRFLSIGLEIAGFEFRTLWMLPLDNRTPECRIQVTSFPKSSKDHFVASHLHCALQAYSDTSGDEASDSNDPAANPISNSEANPTPTPSQSMSDGGETTTDSTKRPPRGVDEVIDRRLQSPLEKKIFAEMVEAFDEADYKRITSLYELNASTLAGKKLAVLLSLLPASCASLSEEAKLTHILDPKLRKIQDFINEDIVKPYVAVGGTRMRNWVFMIQFVALVSQLQRWISDIEGFLTV